MFGAAARKITPTTPQYIAGYSSNRMSTGVHDDIWARAFVVQIGSERLAMVSCDLIGIFRPDVQKIRALVPDIPPHRIQVSSTHVHSGPDVLGLWGAPGKSGVDPAYLSFMIRETAQAINDALANMKPAVIHFASTSDVKGVSKNSRARILDTELSAMLAIEKGTGKTIATVINYACHPEAMNTNEITSDFVHYTRERMEKAMGGLSIYLQGACGGMVTVEFEGSGDRGKDNWAKTEETGVALAEAALKALGSAKTAENPKLEHRWTELITPMENDGFKAAMALGIIPSAGEFRDGKLVTEAHWFKIGPAEFYTMPGEVLPNIGFRLKKLMGGQPNFLIGLCNDELGYILAEADYGIELYKYETSMSVGPYIGDDLVLSLRKLLDKPRPGIAEATKTASKAEQVLRDYMKRFKPDRAGDGKAVWRFEVSGSDGGTYTLVVAGGKANLFSGAGGEQAGCTIKLNAKTLEEVLTGKRNALDAYQAGDVVVEGDVSLAQFLLYVFE